MQQINQTAAELPQMNEGNMRSVVPLGHNAAARVDAVLARLGAPWLVTALPDDADPAALAAALAGADALFTHRFGGDWPPAPNLTLLQVPGAGYDAIDLAALPKGCTVCNVHEHETGIAEYVLLGMLEWVIGMAAMGRPLPHARW